MLCCLYCFLQIIKKELSYGNGLTTISTTFVFYPNIFQNVDLNVCCKKRIYIGVNECKLRVDKVQKTISSTYMTSSKQFKADVKYMLFRI